MKEAKNKIFYLLFFVLVSSGCIAQEDSVWIYEGDKMPFGDGFIQLESPDSLNYKSGDLLFKSPKTQTLKTVNQRRERLRIKKRKSVTVNLWVSFYSRK